VKVPHDSDDVGGKVDGDVLKQGWSPRNFTCVGEIFGHGGVAGLWVIIQTSSQQQWVQSNASISENFQEIQKGIFGFWARTPKSE
jgi:hypothetical protein